MAIAGLEAVKALIARLSTVERPDPGHAKPGRDLRARSRPGRIATGGAAAAILRMGMKLDKRDAVIAAIKAGQRPEGGWSKDDGPAGPRRATYRIMRALYMLHEKPDIDRLLGFVARCRQSDGSYCEHARAARATWAERIRPRS